VCPHRLRHHLVDCPRRHKIQPTFAAVCFQLLIRLWILSTSPECCSPKTLKKRLQPCDINARASQPPRYLITNCALQCCILTMCIYGRPIHLYCDRICRAMQHIKLVRLTRGDPVALRRQGPYTVTPASHVYPGLRARRAMRQTP
jgi:hypothetical protein